MCVLLNFRELIDTFWMNERKLIRVSKSSVQTQFNLSFWYNEWTGINLGINPTDSIQINFIRFDSTHLFDSLFLLSLSIGIKTIDRHNLNWCWFEFTGTIFFDVIDLKLEMKKRLQSIQNEAKKSFLAQKLTGVDVFNLRCDGWPPELETWCPLSPDVGPIYNLIFFCCKFE